MQPLLVPMLWGEEVVVVAVAMNLGGMMFVEEVVVGEERIVLLATTHFVAHLVAPLVDIVGAPYHISRLVVGWGSATTG